MISSGESHAHHRFMLQFFLLANSTGNYYKLLDTRGRVTSSRRVYIGLSNDQRERCVDVETVEDEVLEWSRNFIVKLENADPSTGTLNVLNSSQVTVLITDNDGEYRVYMTTL